MSKSGEGFGARTFHKGSISRTRRGRSGQLVKDFVTHKGTTIKRHGKKYKAYDSRKGSVRKTDKWKFGSDYFGGNPLTPSDYPPTQELLVNPTQATPQQHALAASGGRRRRGGGLSMSNYNDAYPSQLPSMNMGKDTPLNQSLHSGI